MPEEGILVTEFCIDDTCWSAADGGEPQVPISDEPGEVDYSFIATIGGADVRGDGAIETEAWYPNGPDCAPHLARARLELDNEGEVRAIALG